MSDLLREIESSCFPGQKEIGQWKERAQKIQKNKLIWAKSYHGGGSKGNVLEGARALFSKATVLGAKTRGCFGGDKSRWKPSK